MLKTEDIKKLFVEKYKNNDFRTIGNVVQQSKTIELQNVQFEVDINFSYSLASIIIFLNI